MTNWNTEPLLDVKAVLYILDGQFAVEQHGERGQRSIKFIAPESVRAAFAQLPVDSGWLGTAIVRWGYGPAGEFAAMHVPAGLCQLRLTAGRRVEVVSAPLPSLVFAGCGHEYWLWAIKDERPDGASDVFHAPLPNVDERGRICFGNNLVPPASLANLRQAWEVFIKSPFNEHHAQDKCRSASGDVRALLRQLARKKTRHFPRRELRSVMGRPGGTLDQVVEDVFEEGRYDRL
jgi:hypothetical protein